MTDEGGSGELFGASSFCGAEDPDRPGWRCVMAPGPTHEGRAHVYGKGINLGTLAREAARPD